MAIRTFARVCCNMAAALLLLIHYTPARSADFVQNFDISLLASTVFNDRIGNSRFFSGANTESIRISAFVLPTRDSDAFGVADGPDTYFSENGAQTSVSVTHPSFGSLPQAMTFVGQTSGGGGGRHEFTRIFNRANPEIASRLDEFEATPFRITVSNPTAPNGPSLTFDAANFNKDALPAFVTDVKVTVGLNPTISWTIPEGGGVSATNVQIQVRIIDAESEDRTRITAARLVHAVNLPLGQTSYTFGEPFSNAGVPGFPAGLEVGQRYEMAVLLDYRENGQLKGRARTFFEFAPLPDGLGDVSVFLPSVGPNGVFKFDVVVKQGETILIDPVIAVGYDYQIGAGDPNFASVTLPDIGDGLFDLYLFDGTNWVFETVLQAGIEHVFAPGGVDRFRILGIEPSVGLDPSDTTAFITGVSFTADGRFTGTMTPITVEVSESAFLFFGFLRPIESPPAVNAAKAGQSVPVRFSLDGDQGLDIMASGFPESRLVTCDDSVPTGVVESVQSAGQSHLAYDPHTDVYTYVWKTEKAWAGTCRRLTLRFIDGSEHHAQFSFRN